MKSKTKSAKASPAIVREKSEGNDVLVWHTETTGLPLHISAPLDKQPYIVEFAGVRLSRKTGKRLGELSVLVRPPIPIPPDATRIHGISDEDVANAYTFPNAWTDAIRPFLETCGLLIAHNAPFDLQMLDLEFRRMPRPPIGLPRSLCTIGLYRDRYGYDPKLIELYKDVVGKEITQLHRASADVDMLVEIVQKERLWRL